MIPLNCPVCSQKVGVDSSRTGRLATCPGCKSNFRVPGEKTPRPSELRQARLPRQKNDADRTWVDGQPPPTGATQPPEAENEELEISNFQIVESNPHLLIADDKPQPILIKLTTQVGQTPIREIRLHLKETLIGRGPACNLKVKSARVSRKHCLLTYNGGSLSVRDLGSTNGSFLNGQKLDAKAHLVHPGDELCIGPLTFTVVYDPEQVETVAKAAAEQEISPAPLVKDQRVSELFPKTPAPVAEPVLDVLPVDDELPEVLPANSSTQGERNCSHCKYRLPRWLCGHRASAHYRKRVDPRDVCPYFDVNPAYAYYEQVIVRGARRALKGDDGDECLETEASLLETAIRMGLPEDDQVSARLFLAEKYRRLAVLRARDATFIQSLARSPLLAKALKQLEDAVVIDSARDYAQFQSGPSLAMLHLFDNAYNIVSRYIARTCGAEAAIAYLEEKLTLFQHLRGDPMWDMIFQLGCLYAEGHRDNEKAWAYFKRVVHAETTRGCEDEQAKTKNMARKNLIVLSRSWDRD